MELQWKDIIQRIAIAADLQLPMAPLVITGGIFQSFFFYVGGKEEGSLDAYVYIAYNAFVLLKHQRTNLITKLMCLNGPWKSDLTAL